MIRLPHEYRGGLQHPLDDFLEAITAAPDQPEIADAIWKEVESIVWRHGGLCDEQPGPVGPEYKPFTTLFADQPEILDQRPLPPIGPWLKLVRGH